MVVVCCACGQRVSRRRGCRLASRSTWQKQDDEHDKRGKDAGKVGGGSAIGCEGEDERELRNGVYSRWAVWAVGVGSAVCSHSGSSTSE